MAKPSITVTDIEDTELGMKVEGDLGEVKIEDASDTDYDEDVSENTLSTWPQEIVKASSPAVFGTVSVTNSENVQFGNNTYFNGPVTIKQIVQNTLEHDNRGFEHTEEEKIVNPGQPSETKQASPTCDIWNFKLFEFRWWIKMAMMTFCIAVIGGICAIVFITLYNAGQDNTPTTVFNDNDPNRCTMVEGVCYDNNNIKMILIPLVLMLLTCIWYSLYNFTIQYILTKECGHAHDISNYICINEMMNRNKQAYTISKSSFADPLIIAPNHLRIVDRTNWLAAPVEKPINALRLPAPWVIITHTDTESCITQSECVLRVRLIQTFHMESRGWNDIGYNFLVGGDGSAYYGRGWDQEGAHTLGYNKYAIGIAFIGTFNTKSPPKQQIEACQKLIKRGIALGKIAKDYKLFGHRQLSSTLSPGDKLFEILKEWPHFVNYNQTDLNDLVPNY